MRVDAMALRLRPRTAWEAADLGVRLCQHASRDVYACLAIVGLPVAVLALALVGVADWLPVVIVWWAKPWLDRTILFVLARAAFGRQTKPVDLWRSRRQVWLEHCWHTLTLRRLSPWRAFTQPVYQLEGSSLRQSRSRLAVIKRQALGPAAVMTQVFWMAESALGVALVSLVFWFAPQGSGLSLSELFTGEVSSPFALATNLTYILAIGFVEPFYVAAGFAMYLNRRAQLEAWDIEQEFRRAFSAPPSDTARARGPRQVASIAVVCLLLAWPSPAGSQQPTGDGQRPTAREIDKAVESVKADPNLGTQRTVRMLGWKRSDTSDPVNREWVAWLQGFFGWIQEGARLLVWTAVLVGAALLAIYLARVVRARRHGHEAAEEFDAPSHVHHLDIRPGSLPDDVGAAARALWDRGEERAALSLLYRGLLSRLAHVHRAPVRASSTEEDCLRLAAAHAAPGGSAYASALVSVWREAVYGGLKADTVTVRGLCAEFAAALARDRQAGSGQHG
jgi:hypothetical protein